MDCCHLPWTAATRGRIFPRRPAEDGRATAGPVAPRGSILSQDTPKYSLNSFISR